jgi:pimeloyl-ACP methyl ester carboxylesterase
MRLRVLLILLAAAAGAAGLHAALDSRQPAVEAPPGSAPPAKVEPPAKPEDGRARLEARPCGFTTESGRAMECFDFLVPERHGRAGSRMLKLPVIVFKAAEEPKHADPVLLISGGPGAISYTEKRFDYIWKDKFKDQAWLAGRDLIVYDQRGVGGARPALECPEVDATRDDPLNVERAKGAMAACRDRLAREGVDLAAYDTNANVADILALKQAFGFKVWNLWGQSYGTRIALTLMRGNPADVRAVVLDGAYPPEVAGKLNMASGFTTTMDRVFEACAGDEECRADYPDLRRRFEAALARLREHPVAVKSDTAPVLPPKVHQVNDVIFLAVVESLLYTADGVAKLPWLIDRVADGKDEALADSLGDWDLVAYGPYVTAGVSYLVDCNDTPDPDDSEERRVTQRHPYLGAWLGYALAVKPCRIWATRQAPALDRSPVTSDIPTLIVSGWFDIATPPEWAVITARSLKRAQLVLVRAAAHDASDEACAQAAMAAFIQKPGEMDTTLYCGPTPRHPRFKRKSEAE